MKTKQREALADLQNRIGDAADALERLRRKADRLQALFPTQQTADDDFSPTYLRNTTAYGWSPQLRGDIVVNNLVAHAFLTGEVLIKSDGTPWRPAAGGSGSGRPGSGITPYVLSSPRATASN